MSWMRAMAGSASGCLESPGTGVLSAALRPNSSFRPTRSLPMASPRVPAACCSLRPKVRN
eukprot:11839941-Alexandrium_andersonii.AAC.1